MAELFVNIDVPDLARGIEFYARAFALRVVRRFGSGAAELAGASSRVFLLEKKPGTAPSPAVAAARSYSRHWTPVHLDVVASDFAADLKRALDAGATHEGEVEDHTWGRIAYLADPFGHGLCLLELHGRGYDEIAS